VWFFLWALHQFIQGPRLTDHRFILQNDLISWLLEQAPAEERTVDNLIQRILMINFAAIHTTANVRLPEFLVLQQQIGS
jgi:hypothetical protein